MAGQYLLMQKTSETYAKSTEYWGINLTKMPTLNSHTRKEPEANDWMDEHGDDIYYGSTMYLAAFDATISMVKVGSMVEIQEAYDGLLNYLTTGGTELMIYSEWVKRGRMKVSFKSVSEPEYESVDSTNTSFIGTWDLTLHVSDPVSIVCCAANGTNKVLSKQA